MDINLDDIKRQIGIIRSNLNGAYSRALRLHDQELVQNIKDAQDALDIIHHDEEEEERVRNQEINEIEELEAIEEKKKSLLQALEESLKPL